MHEEHLDRIMSEAERQPNQRVSIAAKVIEMALSEGIDLYLDQSGDPHVTLPDHPTVGFPITSRRFKGWLSGKFYTHETKGISSEAFSQVVNTFEGKAISERKRQTLYTRIAKVGQHIYYDLGDDQRVVKIGPDGWEVTTESPVLFRRFPHQSPQVTPALGGELSLLEKYLNLKRGHQPLLLQTYLIAVLVPTIPRASLIITGEQGSAKSTSLTVLRQLIDPSETPLLSPMRDTASLHDTATQHYCFYLDNISYISDDISDALCRLVTGSSSSKRVLYTDNEQLIQKLKLAVGLTGINLVANRADLLDRSLILSLDRISDEERLEEEEFWANFESDKPLILGAMFSALSRALELWPTIKLERKPRMADYARYAAAAAIALGHTKEEFTEAWSSNAERQNQAALESSPTAQVIVKFMEERESWRGSSSELHLELSEIASRMSLLAGGPGGFPKSAHYLWQRIQTVKPNLSAIGIQAHHEQEAAHSTITLRRMKPGSEETMATLATHSADSPHSELLNRVRALCLKLQDGQKWLETHPNQSQEAQSLRNRAETIFTELETLGVSRRTAESLLEFRIENIDGFITSLLNSPPTLPLS